MLSASVMNEIPCTIGCSGFPFFGFNSSDSLAAQKMARIIGDLQRFQVAYNLLEVPELQTYLTRCLEGLAHGGDATSLCT